jgi:hypothetical protein
MPVFGECHPRRLLADYLAYHSAERIHTRLGESPERRHLQVLRPMAKVEKLLSEAGFDEHGEPDGPRHMHA